LQKVDGYCLIFITTEENNMNFSLELEEETDGRWIAEIPELPGVLAYGVTPLQAEARAKALALRVLAERMENEDAIPGINTIEFINRHEPVAIN
jgi:predicted RNase H-like HicB family nuclease